LVDGFQAPSAGVRLAQSRREENAIMTKSGSGIRALLTLTLLALVSGACSGDKAGKDQPDAGDATPCASQIWPTGDTTVHFTVDGLDREYILHVPPAYTGSERVPLVVDMHGFGAGGTRQEVRSGGWKDKADGEGFIVVFPTGSPIPVEVGVGGAEWSAGGGSIPAPSSVDDVIFIRTLVTKITSEGCVDPRRIYATGESNGGAMAHWLGCEAPDLFAAIAPVDADIMGHPCEPSQSIPVVFFRATDDTVAPYGGGQVLPGVIAPGALSSFEEWRTHDACTGDPISTNSYCRGYASCDQGREVVLCSLAPDPGGAAIDHGGSYSYPFANGFKLVDFAWTFLRRFRLP
jgi:polyhydroxybutyrate depolymerase